MLATSGPGRGAALVVRKTMTTAFDPIVLGGTRLANRVVAAPMTRSRAFGPGAEPTELLTTYYAQRASAGSAW